MDPPSSSFSGRMAPPRSGSGSNISGLAPTTLGDTSGASSSTESPALPLSSSLAVQTGLGELGQSLGLPSVVAQQRGSRSTSGSVDTRRSAPVCQVAGCGKDLSRDKEYFKRYRVCRMHSNAREVEMCDGSRGRYCQQCSAFHPLERFDDIKRTCRDRLSDHNLRRRKRVAEAAPVCAPMIDPAVLWQTTPANAAISRSGRAASRHVPTGRAEGLGSSLLAGMPVLQPALMQPLQLPPLSPVMQPAHPAAMPAQRPRASRAAARGATSPRSPPGGILSAAPGGAAGRGSMRRISPPSSAGAVPQSLTQGPVSSELVGVHSPVPAAVAVALAAYEASAAGTADRARATAELLAASRRVVAGDLALGAPYPPAVMHRRGISADSLPTRCRSPMTPTESSNSRPHSGPTSAGELPNPFTPSFQAHLPSLQVPPVAGNVGSTSWPPAVSALGAAHLAASSASLSYQVGTHQSADVDQALALVQQQHLPPPLPATFADDPLLVSGSLAGSLSAAPGGMSLQFMPDPGLAPASAPQWGQQSLQQQGQLAAGGWGLASPLDQLHGPPSLQQAAGLADVPEAYFADLQRRMAHPGTAAPGQQGAAATRPASRMTNRSSGQQPPPPPLLPPLQQQLRPPYWPVSHGMAGYPTPMSPQVPRPNAEALLPGLQTALPPLGPLPSLDTRLTRQRLDLTRGASLPDALPSDLDIDYQPSWAQAPAPPPPSMLGLERASSAYAGLEGPSEMPGGIQLTAGGPPGDFGGLVASTLVDAQAALLAGEAPGAGAYLAASDLILGGSSLDVPAAWLQSDSANALRRPGRLTARVDDTTRVNSMGMTADLSTAAPVSISASGSAGGGVHSEGSGAAMMMLDDPWEQLFGPAGRPL